MRLLVGLLVVLFSFGCLTIRHVQVLPELETRTTVQEIYVPLPAGEFVSFIQAGEEICPEDTPEEISLELKEVLS